MARYGMIIDATTCLGCNACTVACIEENQTAYWNDKVRTRVYEKEVGSYPDVDKIFQTQICVHCDDPPCVDVCPTGASHIGPGGVVLVDYEKCILCGACVEVCPYNARYFYTPEDVKKAKEEFGPNEHIVPHVDKCTLCIHRIEQGLEPACVATCVGESRIFVDWDNLTPEQEALAKKTVPLFSGSDYSNILKGSSFDPKPKIRYIIDKENVVPKKKVGVGVWLWHYLAKPLGLLSIVGILGVLGLNYIITKPQVKKIKEQIEEMHKAEENKEE